MDKATGMSDPMGALNGLHTALDGKFVTLHRCELNQRLQFLRDAPTGKPRFTYALVENNTVIAVAVFYAPLKRPTKIRLPVVVVEPALLEDGAANHSRPRRRSG
jgi:hypothetical protein